MPELLYLDSSALVKLIVDEEHATALGAALGSWRLHASSVIAEVELRRVAYRERSDVARADAVLERLVLLELDDPRRRTAGRVGSSALRSLDAIHLATALSLGPELDAICTYDRRLGADAEAAGLTVLSPGLD